MADCHVNFTSKNNPIAHQLYRALLKQGVSCDEMDEGYGILNHTGTQCPDSKDRICHVKAHDSIVEAEEVIAFALNRYEKYRTIIEGALGDPLQWVLDDLDPKTTFDKEIRTKINAAIGKLKSILQQQGVKEGTEEFKERKAVGLFWLVAYPMKRILKKLSSKEHAFLNPLMSELHVMGLGDFKKYLEQNGGLRADGETLREYSALEALEQRRGDCTETSKILFATFTMGNIESRFIQVPQQGLKLSKPELQKRLKAYLQSLLPGMDHLCLGVKLNGKFRLFDPALIDANARHHNYHPMTLRQYLSYNYAGHTQTNKDEEKGDMLIVRFTMAIQIDPASYMAYNNRGAQLLATDQWSKAIEDLTKSIQIKPNFAIAHGNLGLALIGAGKNKKAIQAFVKFLHHSHHRIDFLFKKASTAARARWKSTPRLKKIQKAFEADTDGLDVALVEANFIILYSLWSGGQRQEAVAKLKQVAAAFEYRKSKKNLSHSTKKVFSKLLKLMPKEMRTDSSTKTHVQTIRAKFR